MRNLIFSKLVCCTLTIMLFILYLCFVYIFILFVHIPIFYIFEYLLYLLPIIISAAYLSLLKRMVLAIAQKRSSPAFTRAPISILQPLAILDTNIVLGIVTKVF